MKAVAQWDVYENPSARAREDVPYLIDVQSGLLAGLRTRLVVPLVAQEGDTAPGLPRRLIPSFEIAGRRLRLVPHEAGVIDATLLRSSVTTLRDERHLITDAMDAVISGV